MQHKTGTIGGFVFGTAGFLLMFKWIILDRTAPSDELAPGIVVVLLIMNEVVCALVGRRLQDRVGKRASTTESK